MQSRIVFRMVLYLPVMLHQNNKSI
jgi:hypothetical protein